ncbi:MAG TPA: hypothetical protein VLE44_01880 [Candidatus Saccharimonadales bacterium]|nr:hypothetical protein [Candidatus Saccharimonadales bacterium]
MKLLAQTFVPIGGTFGSPFGNGKTLGDLTSLIVRIGFVLSGVLILFFIVFAGFQIVAGAGSNNPDAAKKGKEAATTAAVGFAIVFTAYWIVRLIEVITGAKIIS